MPTEKVPLNLVEASRECAELKLGARGASLKVPESGLR